MPDIKLTAPLRRRLSEALAEAFPGWDTLVGLASNGLGFNLERIAAKSNGTDRVIYDLIQWAESRSHVAFLVETARAFNPDNNKLTAVSSELEIGSARGQMTRLERLIDPTHAIEPFAIFTSRLGRIEFQVCQIEYPVPEGRVRGTGFLAGSDLVLTCHHVMEGVIHGTTSPGRVTVRFDYKELPAGAHARPIREIGLAPSGWLVDSSPPDPSDDTGDHSQLPAAERLDYALLRLAEPLGDEPIADAPGAQKRGWLTAAPDAEITPPAMLFVMQHPDGRALGLAFAGQGVKSVNATGTRFRHLVNTERGSSGSPCFDRKLRLVGMHHSGDTAAHPSWNQAIAIAPLRAALHANGHTEALS